MQVKCRRRIGHFASFVRGKARNTRFSCTSSSHFLTWVKFMQAVHEEYNLNYKVLPCIHVLPTRTPLSVTNNSKGQMSLWVLRPPPVRRVHVLKQCFAVRASLQCTWCISSLIFRCALFTLGHTQLS